MSSSCRGIAIPIVIIIATLLLLYFLRILAIFATDEDYPSYKDCAPSICGNSTIRYPFGKCGAVSADCLDDQTLQITFDGQYNYGNGFRARVIGNITESSYYTRTLQIAQYIDFGDSSVFAAENVFDTSESFFNLSQGYIEGTILNCTQQNQDISETLTRLDWGETDRHLFFYNSSDFCGSNTDFCDNCTRYSVVVPTDKKYNISGDKNLEQLKQRGFQITWTIPHSCLSCNATGGTCYYQRDANTEGRAFFFYSDTVNYGDYCICHRGFYKGNCSQGHHTAGHILSVGVTAEIFFGVCALFGIVVVSCIVVRRQFCCTRTATEEQSILACLSVRIMLTSVTDNCCN